MRYVDIDDLCLPDSWLARAQEATAKVKNGDDPNDYAHLWRELKDCLADLLKDKCWYCESPIDRSDNAVDHFRPKNKVSDAKRLHKGYRWLAFNHKNYRYACTFCNSLRKDVQRKKRGGKADRFPLLNEEDRLYDEGPLHLERPALLDPCSLNDWELIGCQQENGKPCATSPEPIERQRAEISIEIYHLGYEPTCKQRHRVTVQLLADVEQAKSLFSLSNDDHERAQDFLTVARKIKRAIDKKAPFSGEMIFLLRGQRHSDHPWIQKLLEA